MFIPFSHIGHLLITQVVNKAQTISSSGKKDLMDEITVNICVGVYAAGLLDIDSKDSRLTNYVNRLYNGRYREFKAKLRAYYKLRRMHEDVLVNPLVEMIVKGVDQWGELCNHFNSDKFRSHHLQT
ncbi:uncharacterized protein Fot_06346 [Forsythia ovata]|uniref:Uncharacterized protein n=1 Tax=Forsythia ovata TaxID=205694 RepID=A0ABD1WSQ3_9LAMI